MFFIGICLLLTTASVEKGTRFVEEGVKELLKARRVLCGSYVYGYYLEDNGYNKTIFEYMQVKCHLFIFALFFFPVTFLSFTFDSPNYIHIFYICLSLI